MDKFDQWGSFGPANTCGSSYEPPTDSTISIFPPSLWHPAFRLWFSKGRTPLRNLPAHRHSRSWQPSQAHRPHLPIREKAAAVMVLSQRQRDELWVPGCKYVGVHGHYGCKHEQTCRERERETSKCSVSVLLKLSCGGSSLLGESVLLNDSR